MYFLTQYCLLPALPAINRADKPGKIRFMMKYEFSGPKHRPAASDPPWSSNDNDSEAHAQSSVE
jgi:hypothetical protein